MKKGGGSSCSCHTVFNGLSPQPFILFHITYYRAGEPGLPEEAVSRLTVTACTHCFEDDPVGQRVFNTIRPTCMMTP